MKYEVTIRLGIIKEEIEADNIKQAREMAMEMADELSDMEILCSSVKVKRVNELTDGGGGR